MLVMTPVLDKEWLMGGQRYEEGQSDLARVQDGELRKEGDVLDTTRVQSSAIHRCGNHCF